MIRIRNNKRFVSTGRKVTIPESIGLNVGDVIEFVVEDDGKIVIKKFEEER